MPRLKEVFVCQTCGASSPKWQGQCAGCGEWNTLLAEVQPAARHGRDAARARGSEPPASLSQEATREEPRLATGSAELDRVLGGGLVSGSVTLIGGDPGIGKSTLMLQTAAALPGTTLYATGEESLKQVALRARRLGLTAAAARLLAETRVEAIVEAAREVKAAALIVDSIQTMYWTAWSPRRAPCRSCVNAPPSSCALPRRAAPP
jgi:DNA repair protein RadA/Sms